nr:immunoglobulin heavy chain junction region [Macaca mulatta]
CAGFTYYSGTSSLERFDVW